MLLNSEREKLQKKLQEFKTFTSVKLIKRLEIKKTIQLRAAYREYAQRKKLRKTISEMERHCKEI